jgi:hypothetical protein
VHNSLLALTAAGFFAFAGMACDNTARGLKQDAAENKEAVKEATADAKDKADATKADAKAEAKDEAADAKRARHRARLRSTLRKRRWTSRLR